MPVVDGKFVEWRTKEQLPDGRWQHFCIRCNAPHNVERMFKDAFDYKVRCGNCEVPEVGMQRAPVSYWD